MATDDRRPVRTDAAFLDALSPGLDRIQRIALLLAGSRADAEDLVAEAVARTLPRWRTGEVDDAVAYVRRVVVNLASSRWRRRSVGRRLDHRALDWLPPADDAAATIAERERTLKAVLRLPPRRRAVVVLRFYDDLSEAQIADVLGVEVGTVKSQLSRALEQLRTELGSLEGT